MTHSPLIYYGYRVLGAVVPFLPRALGYRLAAWAGVLAYYLKPRSAAVLRENLYHVLGDDADEDKVKATARQVFRNLAKNYYDLFHNHALDEEEAAAVVTVRDLHHVQESLKDGRGLIIVSAHFGPFDAAWMIGRSLNLDITAPAEHLKPDKLFRYVCQLRNNAWFKFLPVDQPLMGLYRTLRRGDTVAMAADRDVTRSGILVDFFGTPARMPDGAVRVALRTGANLLTCFAVRQPDNSAVLQIEPPLQLERTGDSEHDTRINVSRIIARMEEWIKRYPDQWLVIHPVWGDGHDGT
jgi:lauroyl/myristoyl acyltransferase